MWKLTEKKYKKLRRNTLIMCILSIVCYTLLIRYTIGVNPEAFIYNSMMDEKPAFAKIETTLWRIVIVGWIGIIILFYREVKKDPNHWFRKFTKNLNELDDD